MKGEEEVTEKEDVVREKDLEDEGLEEVLERE